MLVSRIGQHKGHADHQQVRRYEGGGHMQQRAATPTLLYLNLFGMIVDAFLGSTTRLLLLALATRAAGSYSNIYFSFIFIFSFIYIFIWPKLDLPTMPDSSMGSMSSCLEPQGHKVSTTSRIKLLCGIFCTLNGRSQPETWQLVSLPWKSYSSFELCLRIL